MKKISKEINRILEHTAKMVCVSNTSTLGEVTRSLIIGNIYDVLVDYYKDYYLLTRNKTWYHKSHFKELSELRDDKLKELGI